MSVYPVFEALNVAPLIRPRPGPRRDAPSILDVHLRKLALRLRLLGSGPLWDRDADHERLVHLSLSERTILLTRDRGTLKRRELIHAPADHATDARRQLRNPQEVDVSCIS